MTTEVHFYNSVAFWKKNKILMPNFNHRMSQRYVHVDRRRGAGILQPVQRLGYGLDDTGFEFRKNKAFYLLQTRPDKL